MPNGTKSWITSLESGAGSLVENFGEKPLVHFLLKVETEIDRAKNA
jgi:hypothetical protein